MQKLEKYLNAIKEALNGQQELNIQIKIALNKVNTEIRKEIRV